MSDGSGRATPNDAIRLAAVPDFRLGSLRVQPSLRRVGDGVREESVEPRVMQALVALAEASGAVVSRDMLIDRCWGGRIVGEDAINRCIAKVRPLANMVEPAAFVIETVARVGYRLAVADVTTHARLDQSVAPTSPAANLSAPVEGEAGVTPTDRPPRPELLRAVAAIGVAIAAAASVWLMLAPHALPAPPADRMTLRIDPFSGTGQAGVADLAAEYTQAAIERLSQSAVLVVAAGAPAAAFQAAPDRYILSGVVQTDGDAVKVAVQVVERPTGRLLYTAQTRQSPQAGPAAAYGIMTRLLAGLERPIRLAELARYTGPPRDEQDLVLRASATTINWAPNHDPIGLAFGEQALARDPGNPAAQAVMAALLYNDALASAATTGDAEGRRALTLIDNVLDRSPRNLIDRHLRADLLMLVGDLPAARAEVESALAEEPDNPGILDTMSAILLQQGDVAGSMRLLQPGEGGNNETRRVLQLFALGRYDEALATARHGDAVAPLNPFHLLLEATILARLGQLPAARAAVNSALAEMPPGLGHVSALRQALTNLPDASWQLARESLLEAGMPP